MVSSEAAGTVVSVCMMVLLLNSATGTTCDNLHSKCMWTDTYCTTASSLFDDCTQSCTIINDQSYCSANDVMGCDVL